ncbi:MAG: hypothetical protein QM594_15055, partial [Niabella sp.]
LFQAHSYHHGPALFLKRPLNFHACQSYGIEANKIDRRENLKASLKTMLDHDGSYVLEIMVGKENNVFPMVPQGCSVSEIRLK